MTDCHIGGMLLPHTGKYGDARVLFTAPFARLLAFLHLAGFGKHSGGGSTYMVSEADKMWTSWRRLRPSRRCSQVRGMEAFGGASGTDYHGAAAHGIGHWRQWVEVSIHVPIGEAQAVLPSNGRKVGVWYCLGWGTTAPRWRLAWASTTCRWLSAGLYLRPRHSSTRRLWSVGTLQG